MHNDSKSIITIVRLLLSVVFAGLVYAVPCSAQTEDAEMEALSLFYAEEDLIYSVSKREETYMETPSAVYTITADDIRYSGAKKITDVFRMVPGLDVADVNSFYSGVQARGFSFFPKYARQMLVLIDGRTVYSPQINATFWDQIPLFLENIERIEVVRGPNASLYGANAFNGVINIITRDPETTRGGLVSVTAGNRDSAWGTARFGGGTENLTYRATVGYAQTRGFSDVDDYFRKPQATLRCDYRIDGTSSLSFHGGYAGGDRELSPTIDPEVTSYFLMARYDKKLSDRNSIFLRYYHDYRNSALSFGLEDKMREDDIELQFSRSAERYDLVCGLGYRIDRVRNGFLSDENDFRTYAKNGPHDLKLDTRYNHIFKAFFNCTFHLTPRLHLTTALMIEDNDFVGPMYSPKAALVYEASSHHSLRAGVSRAYRTPSFIEEKADMSVPAPFWPFYIGQKGNRHLDPERITSFELGYRGRFFSGRLKLNLEAFYQNIHDIIIYSEENCSPVSRQNCSIYRYDNRENNYVRGLELSLVLQPLDWWHLQMSYTYQDSSNGYLNRFIIPQKASLVSRFMLPEGFVVNIQAYYVDRMSFGREAWIVPQAVDDYTRLDVRISKTFRHDSIELAVIGQNLLDPRHNEYPETLSAGAANRVFFFECSFRFGQTDSR